MLKIPANHCFQSKMGSWCWILKNGRCTKILILKNARSRIYAGQAYLKLKRNGWPWKWWPIMKNLRLSDLNSSLGCKLLQYPTKPLISIVEKKHEEMRRKPVNSLFRSNHLGITQQKIKLEPIAQQLVLYIFTFWISPNCWVKQGIVETVLGCSWILWFNLNHWTRTWKL